MDLRRIALSMAILGGCFWCLGRVQAVHSEVNATPDGRPTARQIAPATDVVGKNTPSLPSAEAQSEPLLNS